MIGKRLGKQVGIHPYYGVTFKNISNIGRPETLEKKRKFQFNDRDDKDVNGTLMRLLEENPRKAGQFAGQVIDRLPVWQ